MRAFQFAERLIIIIFFLAPEDFGSGFGGETNVSVCISSPEDTGITCFGNEQLRSIQVKDEPHCDTHTPFCFYANDFSGMHVCVCLLLEWERSLRRGCDDSNRDDRCYASVLRCCFVQQRVSVCV